MATTESKPPPAGTPGGGVGLSSTGVFVVTILIQLLGYVPTHFFALNLGELDSGRAVLGTFQLFLLIASSINMIGDLRIGSAYVFFVARGEAPTVATGTYLVLRLVMVASAGAIIWIASPALGIATPELLGLLGLWMLLPVLWSVSNVYSQLLAAQGRSTLGQVPSLVESIVRTSALTVVALNSLTLGPASFAQIIPEVTYCYLLGAAVSAIYSAPLVWRNYRKFRTTVGVRLFKFAWPLMGSLLLLYFSTTVIQFIVVGKYSTDIYNLFLSANGFRILVLAIPAAVAVPLFPHLSGLHQAKDYELIRHRTWAALRYTALATIPVAISLAVYRSNLLNILYVHSYVPAATCLALLGMSAVPAALSQIIGTALNSVGKQRLKLYLTALQFAVLIAASALLMTPVNLFGLSALDAAGAAVLASSVAALLLNTYFMERLIGVRIQVRPIVTIVAAAVVSFVAVSQFNHLLPVNRYYQLAAGVVIGFTVYAFVLAALGELSKSDVRLIGGALGLPSWVGATLSKLCWRDESWPVNPLVEGGGAALRPLDLDLGPPDPDDPRAKPPAR